MIPLHFDPKSFDGEPANDNGAGGGNQSCVLCLLIDVAVGAFIAAAAFLFFAY